MSEKSLQGRRRNRHRADIDDRLRQINVALQIRITNTPNDTTVA